VNANELAITGGRPPPPFAEALAAQLTEAAVARIIPDPGQPRKTFDPAGIRELASNIERHGLQNPVHLRPAGDDLMLVTGARRVEAFKLLGRAHIPAFVHAGPPAPRQLRLLQVSENLLREGVNPIEQALAFQECMDGGTAAGLARELGVAVSTITRALKLLSALPPDIQESVRQGLIPGTVAREMCALDHDDAKRDLARRWQAGELKSRAEVIAAVRAAKNGNGAAAPGGFSCQEAGVKISVTIPAGQDMAAAEAALRAVLKDLKDHGARGLAHFQGFLDRKAASRKAADRLQQAKDELEAHAS
jgi:ParB/RepB/Spo0J family partition protein